MHGDPETLDALQVLIERGGLDRDLMIELRRQFLELTERDGRSPAPENQPERAEA